MARCTRSASIRSTSWNEASRTLEVVFLANEAITRKTWEGVSFCEVLPLSAGRFERFKGRASMFVEHSPHARNAIGVIEDWWMEPGPDGPLLGVCRVRMSDVAADADLVRKVITGILPGVSVGYDVDGWAESVEDGVTTRTATGWEALEVSTTGIPADVGAHVRAFGGRMSGNAEKLMGAIQALAGEDKPLSKVYSEVAKAAKLSPEDVAAFAKGEADPSPEQLAGLALALGLPVELADGPAVDPEAPEVPDADEAEAATAPKVETDPNETAPADPPDQESPMANAHDPAAERKRASEIITLANRHGHAAKAAEWVASGKSTAAVRAVILDGMAAADDAVGIGAAHPAGVKITRDAQDTRAKDFEAAIWNRGHRGELPDSARKFRSRSITEAVRLYLTEQGEEVQDLSTEDLAKVALGGRVNRGYGRATLVSADLPNLLLNVGNKSLLKGFGEYDPIYREIAQETDASDFNPIRPILASSFPDLNEVPEGADYEDGVLSDSAESFTPKRYGRVIKLSVEMLTKDNVGGLTRIPATYGRRVQRKRDALALGIINTNAALSDAVALFHASHANLATGGDIGAPTSATLAAAREALGLQTNIDGDVETIRPKVLLVPVAHEDAALRLVEGQYMAATHANSRLKWIEQLQVISHGLLDATSSDAWYLLADPMDWPVLQWAEVSGHGPRFDSEYDWDSDALKMKVVDSFGVGAVDHRGGYKNAGV